MLSRKTTRGLSRTPLLAVALAATSLAACVSAPRQPLPPERTSESPNAIEVSMTHQTLAVHFLPGEGSPRAGDVEALNVLLAAGDVGRGDTVRIERAAGALADGRARALAAALARQGLRPTVAPPGGAPDDELRLVLEHATATVPNCPNWSKPPGNDLDNTLPSNFGCATAIDLAAMVADPRDLVEGRPLAPVVGDAAVLAMHRYRTGAPEKPEDTWYQPFKDASTYMATAPARPQAPPDATDKAPAGASSAESGPVPPPVSSSPQ